MNLFLLLLALQAQEPAQVGARLTPVEIRVGETTVLRVDVETDGERAQIQPFRTLPPGIEVQGSRSYDQRQFSLPGGTRRFISREFVLVARAPGRYRIPSVTVIVGGETRTTPAQLLTVNPAPGGGAGRPSTAGEGVALDAWLDADTVYVGQQVTFTAEAMFSQQARLRLRRAPEYEPPSPSGFWIHDLEDRRSPTRRSLDGDPYEVQRFRRALFPLTPGTYRIPPAYLEYEMRRGLLYAPETLRATSDTLRLVVLPVPEPHPEGFTGAVGRFGLSASLEPTRVPAGEAVVLTVDVVGQGNVKALPPPELPEMEGVEVFPPVEESETDLDDAVVRGRKRFSWVLIPRRTGTVEIPGVRYPYFDPGAGGFATAAAPSLSLSVTPGAAGPSAGDDGAPATVRYLRTSPAGEDRLGWVLDPWFAAVQLLTLLLVASAVGIRGRRGRSVPTAGVLRRRRKRIVSGLEARIADSDAALFSDAEALARQWVAERLGLSAREAADPATLILAGVGQGTAHSFRSLLDRLAAARYAPSSPGPEARRDMVRSLGTLLDRIDREAPVRRRVRRRAARAGVLALLLLGGGAAPGWAGTVPETAAPPQDASTLFEEGRRAFDDERYLDAADQFDRYVAARPTDPAGWYNLGTAYHHAGYGGYAIWAWLQVPRLDPRDRDVRHNLRIVGVPPELVARASPALPFRPTELFLLASVAWLVAGLAGAAAILRQGRRARIVSAVAVLLALGLAASGWASTRSAETLILLDPGTLRAGPALRADPVTELDAGAGLVPISRDGEWIRVRTLRGTEGWIEANDTGSL